MSTPSTPSSPPSHSSRLRITIRASIRGPKTSELTRDQRLNCQLLHEIGWTYYRIRDFTGHTYAQIHQACARPASPQKRTGRPSVLTQAQVEELVECLRVS